MADEPKTKGGRGLPDFLRVSVLRGVLDERTAERVELYRRTRGLGFFESQSAFLNDPPDPDLTFDNFVVCKGNSFALELAHTVVTKSSSRSPYNPLYIYGDIGLGKTHLLSAIANAAEDKRVLLLNVSDFETEVERANRLCKRAELRDWLYSAEILLLDDIQLCESREDVQRDLFAVLNYMMRTRRWVVITSDVPPTRLAGVESRLLSRLGAGVIVSLHMGDRIERRAFVESFLDERPMPEEVIDYLAENVSENVRRLKAAVTQLLILNEANAGPLTLDAAREFLAPQDAPGRAGGIPVPDPGAPTSGYHQEPKLPQTVVSRFKEMLDEAESEDEQALALQIALGERIRQLRKEEGTEEAVEKLEQALNLLRQGRREEAIRCIST